MALPADRDTVFVQPPWKWYKYANPDFRHALFKISKWIRKEAICRLLSQNNLNFDSAEDINWLYFWANNGGVKVDVEYNIYKLQFLEFDRYNQHMDYNKFLDRVVKASQLRSLKMRFAAFRLGGDSVDDIIQEYELDRLRVMRGLEHVECWLWNYGNNHSSPRMLELTRWLREEMCKPMGMVSEEAQSIAKAV